MLLELLSLRVTRRGAQDGRGNTRDFENIDEFVSPNEKSLTGVVISDTLLQVNKTIV